MRWVVAVGLLIVLCAPWAASADVGMERQFTDLVHRERAAAGIPAYAEKGDLVDVARRQAQRMAAERRLYHNPNLGDDVQNWDAVGENVGRGPSVETIHQAFMDSPSHRSEILSRTFTEVGVGVAIASDGEIWVAQVFRKPSSQHQPAPTPAPAPTTTTRPAPPPTTAPPAPPTTAAPTSTTTTSTTSTTVAAPPPPSSPTPEVLAAVAAPATPVVAPTPLAAVVTDGPARSGSSAEPEVSNAIALAATLLVLVVSAQVRYVSREIGERSLATARTVSSPRRTLAASAATLP